MDFHINSNDQTEYPEFMHVPGRYDRQISLWGDNGQTAIGNASLCILGTSCSALETLRALILTSVKAITVVDDKKVNEGDISDGYLFSPKDLGLSRAEAAVTILSTLNADVNVNYICQSPQYFIKGHNSNFFSNYNVVMAFDLSYGDFATLENLCWERDTHLVISKQVGYMSMISVISREVHVYHFNEACIYDPLYIRPFDSLLHCIDSLESLSPGYKSDNKVSIPYVLILHKAVNMWNEDIRKTVDSPQRRLPKSAEEMQEFEIVLRKLLSVANVHEDSASEALRRYKMEFIAPPVSKSLEKIINSVEDGGKCGGRTDRVKIFWVLARAMLMFIDENGVVPNPGILPDMHSKTSDYLDVVKLYREKSIKDEKLVNEYVKIAAIKEGVPYEDIDPQYVTTWCKNSNRIQLLSFPRIFFCDGTTSRHKHKGMLKSNLAEIILSIMRTANNLFPEGATDAELFHHVSLMNASKRPNATLGSDSPSSDTLSVEDIVTILSEWLSKPSQYNRLVSVLTGGVVSQEVTKLITEAFIPVETVVIDGNLIDVTRSYSEEIAYDWLQLSM